MTSKPSELLTMRSEAPSQQHRYEQDTSVQEKPKRVPLRGGMVKLLQALFQEVSVWEGGGRRRGGASEGLSGERVGSVMVPGVSARRWS